MEGISTEMERFQEGRKLACAGARLHIGILPSSVNRLQRSSALAMNRLDTFTVAVFIMPLAAVAVVIEDPVDAGAALSGAFCVEGATSAGVTVPLPAGVFPSLVTTTVTSFPCVSRRACGKALKQASRRGGRRVLTRSRRAATCLESPVDEVLLYSYCKAEGLSVCMI